MTENLQGSVKCSDIKCGGMATENFTPTEGVGWGPTGPPYSMIVLSRSAQRALLACCKL